MSGLKSRRKGRRVEYLLRDELRVKYGMQADRVPLSGASQGFKGDIRVIPEHGAPPEYIEVKVRQNEFKEIYAHVHSGLRFVFTFDKNIVWISDDFKLIRPPLEVVYPYPLPESKTLLRKMHKLMSFVKDCDYLAIKIDRKPFLFLKFYPYGGI